MIAFKFAALSGVTIFFGGVSIMPETVVDGNTLIPLGIFMTGAFVIASAAWKIGVGLTKLDSRLQSMETRITAIENKCRQLHKSE